LSNTKFTSRKINKYFEQFAECEQQIAIELFSNLKQQPLFQNVLCIPAYDESFESINLLFQNINQLKNFQPTKHNLLIFIINTPLSEDRLNPIAQAQIGNMPLAEKRSQLLAENISNTFKTLEQYKHLSLHSIFDSIELLLIKRIGS